MAATVLRCPRGRCGTREDGFPLVKYGAAPRLKRNYFGLVSTLFIDDEILFCANEQSETSKRPRFPSFPRIRPVLVAARARARHTLFSPFLRCNDVRTKDVNKSRRKRGRQWKTSDGGEKGEKE